MYGYDAGVLGGVQTTKPFLDAIGNPTGTYVIPMIASSYTLAAAVCSLAVTVLGMPLGRRGCILMGDGLVIVSTAVQASAMSVPHIIVGRILCGFGIGFISCSVPTYMAEMSIDEKERGPEVSISACGSSPASHSPTGSILDSRASTLKFPGDFPSLSKPSSPSFRSVVCSSYRTLRGGIMPEAGRLRETTL